MRRGREAAALLLFAASVYLCLGLASLRIDPHDAGFHGADWVGPVGSWIAGVMVRAVGLVAWLVPVELAVLGVPLLTRRPNRATALRAAGDLVVALVLAALVQVAFPSLLAFGRMPAGGNAGLLIGELMRGAFSTAGSFLVGSTIVGLILIGRSSFSFIQTCQRVLELSRLMFFRVLGTSRRIFAAWRRAREIRREHDEREREAAKPHIETRTSDEAIIAQLTDDDSDSFPVEMTGTPPLAIVEALKARFDERKALLSDAPPLVTEPVASEPDEAIAEPAEEPEPSARSAKKRVPQKNAPEGPRIIDTRAQTKAKRIRPGSAASRSSRYELPPTSLLDDPPPLITRIEKDALYEQAKRLEQVLANYKVEGSVVDILPGPTVTTFEFEPKPGTKVSSVAKLSDDLALGLSRKVRIIAPIPNKSRIGFELPNDERIPVNLRELIEDERFGKLADKVPLPVVLGKNIVGAPVYADLASMPHVIVAGATGAGKSVGLNVMLASLLFRRSPDELRLLMVDPKVVELAPFDGIPHLLLPVVTDMKQAATALKWAVDEMERRYQLFANAGTKNIATYNGWVEKVARGDAAPPDPTDVEALTSEGEVVSVAPAAEGSDGLRLPGRLPHIVVVVDEFADLMMQQGKEVEAAVARLAQKARAAGMHVIVATQRPSVDVITGMIKANFPTRVAFRVAQKVDSRTILDEQGSELLLGKGDMLVKLNGAQDTQRVQCPFVSEDEVSRLTSYLREQGAPEYHDAILKASEEDEDELEEEPTDARFDEAVRIVAETQRCSTSWLQRKMTIGYNRAAKIVEMMERRGMVGPPNGARDREVCLPAP